MGGTKTPLGNYSTTTHELRRPRSSIGGNFGASHGHGHSQSVSNIEFDETREPDFATSSRRNTYGKGELEGTVPTGSALPRRKSGGIAIARRTSGGVSKEDDKTMKPPGRPRKLSELPEKT
jgi:hypothetical protein